MGVGGCLGEPVRDRDKEKWRLQSRIYKGRVVVSQRAVRRLGREKMTYKKIKGHGIMGYIFLGFTSLNFLVIALLGWASGYKI